MLHDDSWRYNLRNQLQLELESRSISRRVQTVTGWMLNKRYVMSQALTLSIICI